MKNFIKYVREFGFIFAFKYYFCSMLMIFSKKNQKFRNKVVKNYLQKHFSSFVSKELPKQVETSSKKIWCFWWTGLETAPEIVKLCINNIKNHSKNYEVVVIDKNNIKDYVEIPQNIYNKVESGNISITHLSDILRMSLLSQHGGMWMDATIYYNGNDLQEYLQHDFYTLKRKENNSRFISNNKWTGYFLSTNKGNLLVENVKNLFIAYWEKHNTLIDYFLIDFFIDLVYTNNKEVRLMMDNVPYNNENNEKLLTIINEPYKEEVLKELSKNTNIFKLSWKKEFYLENSGEKTFYNYILNKDNNE